jgi:DNA-binding NarL/FixJ family response regulator
MVHAIDDARAASDDRRWGDAWRLWSTFAPESLDVDDLDRAATAGYLTGHDDEGFARWVRAHQLCLVDGAVHRAANFGGKLAQGFGFKGDLGRCRGWVDRTARLLEEANIDCVEQGYLQYGLGMLRIFEAGDLAGAHTHFVQAGKIGARFAHRELVTSARIGEGRMLIYLGDITEGLALLDEAMVAIEAGELSPLAAGDAYCTVIDACSELFDLSRCRAWTESFVGWCDAQQELVLYRGHCFLHRAEVLELLGAWPEALVQARHACDRLAAPVNPAALDEAQDPISRARLLASYVEIVLATRDTTARDAAEELRQVAATLGTPLLRAQAARAAGTVLRAEGDPKAALVELRRAFNEFHALAMPYDAARTRLLIAEACASLGDHDGAAMESSAARAVLDALAPTAAALNATFEPGTAPSLEGLTRRELEILRLLARGKTNRGIAHDLVISEKTVASHVSHIFTKLGVTSRSAATAYAYDHELVE